MGVAIIWFNLLVSYYIGIERLGQGGMVISYEILTKFISRTHSLKAMGS
jgi:hypothetical protein